MVIGTMRLWIPKSADDPGPVVRRMHLGAKTAQITIGRHQQVMRNDIDDWQPYHGLHGQPVLASVITCLFSLGCRL